MSTESELDPRAQRSRAAMLDAAMRLLARAGMEGVTHQAVAHEAGVGRATVYRHWPKRLQLIIDTLEGSNTGLFEFADGDLRDVVSGQFQQRIQWLNQPFAGAVIGALIGRGDVDPEIGLIREGLFRPAQDALERAIASAVGHGQLLPSTPVHSAATLIFGAVLYERHMLGSELTGDLVRQIVDTALTAWVVDR